MRAIIAALALLAGASGASAAEELISQRPAEARPEVMVLGTLHFGNPGQDAVNLQVPSVMSAERQKQVEAAVARLARFRPTRIAVEYPALRQADLDRRYADYRQGRYRLSANEIDQLGLRLAAKLGLPRVDAIDWNDYPPGREEDYDYVAYAAKNGLGDRLAAIRAARDTEASNARLASQDVTQWLVGANQPAAIAADERIYFDYAMLGDQRSSPGANWVANWYGRNLKIFANLVRLKAAPSERILIIYGAGHAGPLTDMARRSGAFRLVDPLPFLRR